MPRLLFPLAALCVALSLPAPSAFAAEICQNFQPDVTSDDDVVRARAVFDEAQRAKAASCFEQADRLLEAAHRLDPMPRYLYERILLRETMGHPDFAHELLIAHREALSADPSIGDIEALDARLREAIRQRAASGSVRHRSAVHIVGPIALAAAGVTSLVVAGVGMAAPCDSRAADGTCLIGKTPVWGRVAAYGIGGMLGIGAALLWSVAAPREDSSRTFHVTPTGFSIAF